MTISLQAAQAQLDLYMQCERDIITRGVSVRISDRQLTRANLPEVQAGIKMYSEMVNRLSGRRRIRMRSIIPTD